MPLWSYVFKVPWRDVLRYAPHVIDRAERLLEFVRATQAKPVVSDADPDSAVGDLASQVEALERAQVAQAELFSQVAGQLEKVSEALRALSARVTVALWLAAAALALALASLLMRLF